MARLVAVPRAEPLVDRFGRLAADIDDPGDWEDDDGDEMGDLFGIPRT